MNSSVQYPNATNTSMSMFANNMSGIFQHKEVKQVCRNDKILESNNSDEEDPKPTPIQGKVQSPKPENSSLKKIAYNHQKDPTVLAIKKWYKIRGWSLLYPLAVSLYFAITEMNINLRTIAYTALALICIWGFINIKNFHPRKNLTFIVLVVLCLMVPVIDFLSQFSIIGDQGWKIMGSYQSCFNFKGEAHNERNQRLHDSLCSVVKMVYYLNGLIYVCTIWCLSMYLVATSKLMTLTNHVSDRGGYRTRFNDEGDFNVDDD